MRLRARDAHAAARVDPFPGEELHAQRDGGRRLRRAGRVRRRGHARVSRRAGLGLACAQRRPAQHARRRRPDRRRVRVEAAGRLVGGVRRRRGDARDRRRRGLHAGPQLERHGDRTAARGGAVVAPVRRPDDRPQRRRGRRRPRLRLDGDPGVRARRPQRPHAVGPAPAREPPRGDRHGARLRAPHAVHLDRAGQRESAVLAWRTGDPVGARRPLRPYALEVGQRAGEPVGAARPQLRRRPVVPPGLRRPLPLRNGRQPRGPSPGSPDIRGAAAGRDRTDGPTRSSSSTRAPESWRGRIRCCRTTCSTGISRAPSS
jgi:hypothetical protein